MDKYQIETENRIRQIENMHNKFSKRLKQINSFADMSLIKTTKGDTDYYYLNDSKSKKRKYLGKANNKEVVDTAEKDIEALLDVMESYESLSYDVINEKLPKAYQDSVPNLKKGSRTDSRVAEWLSRKKELKSRVVEKYARDLRHRAADGTMVRSKSEVIIADMLFMNDIPYVYEVPHFFDGDILNLDFTVLSTMDYETEIVIEHQGMMGMQQYREKYMHTLMKCLEFGMIPNVDIFFTFDDLDGNFDSEQIRKIIYSILKEA